MPSPNPKWRNALLPATATLQDAIRNLNDSALQIALVVSPEEMLIGTITDGDIRRGLLRGLSLSSRVDDIVHREPLVAPPELGREIVLQLNRETNAFIREPQRSAGDTYTTVGSGSPEEVADFVRRDRELWSRITRELKIEPE